MSIASQDHPLTAKTVWLPFVLSWLVGSVAAYFLTSFFSNFYALSYQFFFLTLLFQLLCGITVFLFFGEIVPKLSAEKHPDWLTTLTLLIAFLMSFAAVVISWQFPGLFQRQILFMDSARLPFFLVLSL